MNKDIPKYKTRGERVRTYATVVQLTLALATLVILVIVHFL